MGLVIPKIAQGFAYLGAVLTALASPIGLIVAAFAGWAYIMLENEKNIKTLDQALWGATDDVTALSDEIVNAGSVLANYKAGLDEATESQEENLLVTAEQILKEHELAMAIARVTEAYKEKSLSQFETAQHRAGLASGEANASQMAKARAYYEGLGYSERQIQSMLEGMGAGQLAEFFGKDYTPSKGPISFVGGRAFERVQTGPGVGDFEVRPYAEGGIIDHKQIAIMGENAPAVKEAVLPMDGGGGGVGLETTIVTQVILDGELMTEAYERRAGEAYLRRTRMGG